MKPIYKPIACLLFCLAANSSIADQPLKTTFIGKDSTRLGEVYRNYAVNCGAGKQGLITSWGGLGAKWCVGTDDSRGNCSRIRGDVTRRACAETISQPGDATHSIAEM